jgi:hypothetical protein
VGRNTLAAQLTAAGLIPSGGGQALAAMQLDPVPLAPGLARRFVDSHLDGLPVSQRDAALLLTSELVTGVILHARTSLEVGVGRLAGDVVLAVSDHDPQSADKIVNPLRGRTKALVTALADEHGTLAGVRSNTVWLVLRAHGRATGAGALEASSARN